jgi:lipoprotein-releasing system permease protein
MEKFLTGLMLLTIVAVGAVNIVSTLVMAVAEKGPDIAILRTMGASRGVIMRLFIVQGGVSGLIGTGLGAILGVFIAINLADISLTLERAVGWATGNSNIVFVSHLQTQVIWSEVALVCSAGLVISLIATLYPAYRASKIEPAEVLRYE